MMFEVTVSFDAVVCDNSTQGGVVDFVTLTKCD